MELDLELRQKQSLRLSPMLLQSMKILQMNAADLQGFLSEEMQENPVLEGELPPCGAVEASALAKKLDWVNAQSARRSAARRDDAELPAAELLAAPRWEESLEAHLLFQTDDWALDARERSCLRYLIHSVTPSGYLRERAEECAARFDLDVRAIEALLTRLRALDPPGICAENLAGCLAAQLRLIPDGGLALRIAEGYLDDAAALRLPQIARALGCPQRQVEKALALIRTLDPAPGAQFQMAENTAYVIPDILITRTGEGLVASVNGALLPELSISAYYEALQRENPGEDVQEYLNERLQRANWVINGVRQRQETLQNCADAILRLQRAFFEGSAAALAPMTMGDVAEAIHMHPSTVSRALRDKYLQSDRGVFPLKALFSRAVSGESGGSADLAKRRLAELVAAEDGVEPRSDQRLCELLCAEGVAISRRTVAKYREELRIPGSALRKKRAQTS